jgi:hypothetical protein
MVKLEDTAVIEREGPRLLTAAPRQLVEILTEA